MGLLGLGLGRGKNRKRIEKNRKNPKVGKQKQTEQANNQTNKNTDRCPTRTTPKEKCIICTGPHTNLMFCPKLTQYLPFGRYQTPPECLCVKCLSTKHWNAKKCNHMDNRFYKTQLCPTTKKHFLMCTGCEHHLPAIRYMSNHHDPSLGYKNFTVMKKLFGDDMFKAMIARDSAVLNQ